MKTETEKELELKELNEWVSIHVLGWQKKRCPIHHSYDCCGRKRMPNPITNPADAMQVLEKCVLKLELKRAFPAIEKYSDFDGFHGWKVSALFSTGNQDTFSEVAETLSLAICKFAKQLFSK